MKRVVHGLLLMSIAVILTGLSLAPLLKALSASKTPGPSDFKNLRFEHLTPEEGLSAPTVRSIVQDQQGFMWFVTSDGLCRFDGYAFKTYRNNPRDPNSINTDNSLTLYVDRQGVLWVGTWSNGLNSFDRTTEQFAHYLHDPQNPFSLSHNRVNVIFEDTRGRFWIGTEGGGLNRFERTSGQFLHYQHNPSDSRSLSYDVVKTIVEDASGQLWIGTLGGGLNKLDPDSGQFTHYQHDPRNANSLIYDNVEAMACDAAGGLWIGTMAGLDYFVPATEKFTHYRRNPADPQSLSNDDVFAIYVDSSGVVWIATSGGGLNIFDPMAKKFTRVPFNSIDPYAFHGDHVSSICADRSGALWIATLSEGVNRLDRAAANFELYQTNPNTSGSVGQGAIWSILRDHSGILWVGSVGSGLNKFDPVTNRFKCYRNNPADSRSLSSDHVFAIVEDAAGALWIGTRAGLNRFDRKSDQFTRFIHDPDNSASLSENWVGGLHVDRKGRLWVGTLGKGLDLYDPAANGFRHYQADPSNPRSLSDNNPFAFAEDPSGLLWIGTVSGGLNQFDPETGLFTRYLHNLNDFNSLISNDVEHCYLDPAGVLWLATPEGLDKFDTRTETFTHYAREGVARKAIASVIGDLQGNLWLGMLSGGLVRFNPVNRSFKTYDRSDGLQSNDFLPRAAWRDVDGKLFFGGMDGINAFYPDLLRDNAYIPPVVITDFRIFNRSVLVGGKESPLQRAVNETDTITLLHRQSVFSFDFAALNYRAPKNNQYAYMLEGFDKDWNYVDSSRRFAAYTSLAPGRYTFRVKGSNNDSVWNEAGKSIRIVIIPPWWRTWWFYTLVIASALGIGLCIYRTKSHQIKSLQAAERKYREVFNATSDAMLIQDETCRVLDVNDRMCAMFGCNRETALGLPIGNISLGSPPYSQLEAEGHVRRAVQEGPQIFQWQSKRCNGDLFWTEVALHASEIAGEKRVIASVRDITERRHLEEQLIQAQKMESIGRLAGGVAHDFNNLLTAISGNVEMALLENDVSPDVEMCLKAIEKASVSAADLTKQLLAFSRKQIIEQKVIDLGELIVDMEKMLSRVIGEDITLKTFVQPEILMVKVDPGQMRQIIMNLAVNARDAMPDGGILTLETSSVFLDETYCQLHKYASPGEYVLLAVSDTGGGMSEEVKKNLFEPFFTTKSIGKGTGLGLATVYGAVKQNNGTIEVYSEPEKGACFKIYFPKASGEREMFSMGSDKKSIIGGTETILVVEDDSAVLSYSRKMLESLGYRVLTASNGEEALRVAQEHAGEIQLLITDVIMPGMNGRQIAEKLTKKYPGLMSLYCSGYTDNAIVHHGVLEPNLHFIGKPFSMPTLSRKIRSLLDGAEEPDQ
jgi:PAS domain S-box-containing protein